MMRDAASVRIDLKAPATQRHHRERAAPALSGSLFQKFGFFMYFPRILCLSEILNLGI